MIKYLFILFFCFSAIVISAQDHFVIYSTKGEVTMSRKRKTVIVNPGDKILSTNTITIAEGSGITLLGKEGTFFSTTEPGTHLLNKFNDSCHHSEGKLLNSFFRFLYDQATKKITRRNYFSDPQPRTGPIYPVWIDRKSFDTVNYSGIGGDVGFCWQSYTKEKEHEFILYAASNFETPIYKVIAKNLRLPFADIASQIKPGNSYYWTANVIGYDDGPGYFVLNYVTNKTYDSVLTAIKDQRPALEGPAEEAYRTAFMLEYLHYPAEAYQYYIKAAGSASPNPLYRSTLVVFKKDFGIDNR